MYLLVKFVSVELVLFLIKSSNISIIVYVDVILKRRAAFHCLRMINVITLDHVN